jgi:EAL domain-containing protein (putative c-di-GMP-specific phosphodiesterase class I)
MGETVGPSIDANALRRAVAEGELFLEYQPKIALATGALAGVEALVRWRHPQLGRVPPSEFVPLAESTGTIELLTRWVVGACGRQWVEWRHAGLTVPISFNVSALNLAHMDFPDTVDEILRDAGADCVNFEVELTESATQSTINLLDTLTRLRLRGVRISLDDFGTGYSSLLQLQRLPFSAIKIDRSFVIDAERSEDCRVIIRSIIDLAHNLGMESVAEGVESETTLKLLYDLGCDAAQGYHIGRPMPGSTMLEFARGRNAVEVKEPAKDPVAAKDPLAEPGKLRRMIRQKRA